MRSIFPLVFLFITLVFFTCDSNVENTEEQGNEMEVDKTEVQTPTSGVSLIVLGTVQDAGSPQIGCQKECCIDLFENPDHSRRVVSLGVVDHDNQKKYLFEASPDLPEQMEMLNEYGGFDLSDVPDGVFLTHAHIGHYTGLMYFGKEAMNANQARVYAMPGMADFLENNGPWSQLVKNKNITLDSLRASNSIALGDQISLTPLLVPHRDEYSETVGFVISGPEKTALFIPDIDKWEKWERDISEMIKKVDYAFLDATFYDGEEINNRDISEIPHPFVVESFRTFEYLSPEDKDKIYFIHFNHTNPLLNSESYQTKEVIGQGYHVAEIEMTFSL